MFASHRFILHLNFPAIIHINGHVKALTDRSYAHINHLFDAFPHRELYSLNCQLASFSRNGNFLATWDLFCHMHCSCPKFDAYTFTPILSACSALPGPERGRQVHALMIKTGTDIGTVTKTALIDMYSKYGYFGDSVKAFQEVKFKDVVTWNSLLSSFVKHGLAKEALGVFSKMRREGVQFSEFTLCSVLKACAFIEAFQQGKQVHALVVVMGRDLVVLGTALIDFYSSIAHISEAMKVFSSLSWTKDDIMCNSFITRCIQNRRYKEAFSIMSIRKPNVVAFTSALTACSENFDLWIGRQIHCVATRFGFTSDTQLCNKLIDMYAKCGKLLNARSLFDGMFHKDVVSWTSMIDAYGRHGHGHEALELFNKMEQEGTMVSPNSVTFLAVLSACGHSGLVEEGRELFNMVEKKYGLHPGVEHYSCFIDILGRAGRVEDAWCLFRDMEKNGSRPTTAVWAALLNACRLNLDVSRGEFAAKKLLELEPNNPGNYIMLSNFYASLGMWDFVDSLRSQMRDSRLIKEVGSSWVTVPLMVPTSLQI
ncbi:hypothetical protein P3X46_026817 [Hevea brasiliensis]|uniref:Pentacotripeptide-repeat region of PRORP domain-containing protein n=1 Tax=Hevea brasiliensis TaxID=3981 RepID=A0ABQ9L131_HEVBR|nr:pentatricopeptide repeat-containing protein At5g66500, mitochondrial [Hevea brasiliensis]KAJ9153370.1 hypothetical protein P3X46_026817 [Hevea brasiliensis]